MEGYTNILGLIEFPIFFTGLFQISRVVVLVAKLCPTLATPWTVALQAPLFMEFSRREYWSGLPFTSPGDLPDPGIEPRSPTMQADSSPSKLPGFSSVQSLRRVQLFVTP